MSTAAKRGIAQAPEL